MRNSKWLVATALAFVAAAAPGCGGTKCRPAAASSSDVIGPNDTKKSSPMPGVVEIYRQGSPVRIGYVCCDLTSTGASWWLLNGNLTPPVMPNSPMWGDDVVWQRVNEVPTTGADLCAGFGGLLTNPKLWHVTSDDGANCPGH